jgi:putative membrane protein
MKIAGEVLVGIVALEHLYFFYLEAVVFTTPRGQAIFGTTPEQAAGSAALAKNQGLYNGFLAAALAWGLIVTNDEVSFEFKLYGLICVVVAAIVGGLTVSRRIMIVQGVPAVVGLVLVLLGGR